MTSGWSFRCTACGRCCNSPPQMALPELFHHAGRFIGALGVRRLRFGPGTDEAQLALASRLLHPGRQRGEWFALATLAIGDPAHGRCPALLDDGCCAVHADRKPRACTVVPLDELLPDGRQHAVLAARAPGGAESLGVDCIAPGEREGWRPLVRSKAPDIEARKALQARRADLAADRRWWGDAVFAQLRDAGIEERCPREGLLTLPLAPVLTQVAGLSAACRARCLEYLELQEVLVERSLASAGGRGRAEDEDFVAQLHGFAAIHARLRERLWKPAPQQAFTSDAAQAEAWLGLDVAQVFH